MRFMRRAFMFLLRPLFGNPAILVGSVVLRPHVTTGLLLSERYVLQTIFPRPMFCQRLNFLFKHMNNGIKEIYSDRDCCLR